MPSGPLPRSTPSAQGVRAAGIAAFVDALEADPGIDPHSLMVVRHGQVVAEGWWAPYTPDRVHLLYSLSKTFTSTAVGFAVEEGLFGLDDAVADHFPEFRDELPEASRRIRVRDALAMATGHEQEMVQAAVQTDLAEPVRGFLLHPPEREPGSVFAYNQPATYTVATILQRAAGQGLIEYLRPRLLDPLGLGPVSWQQHPPGRDLGFSGLHATTEAVAKLGLLHLQDGVWEGEQLLPAGWAAEVRERRVDTAPWATDPDWRQGYGFQVWMARHGYRGDGAFGQFCLILPEQDLVVATTMATERMQAVLDAAWEHLLPAVADGPVDDADDAALAERLSLLTLEPAAAGAPPADVLGSWRDGTLTAELSEGVLVLSDGGTVLRLPFGAAGWTVVDDDPAAPPVAVGGGWEGDTVHVDLLFLESPHRLFVDLTPEGGIATRWGTAPLGFPPFSTLLDQRAPRPLR